MRLLDRLQAKLELRRLEKRYTLRTNRDGFTSDAIYVDGEYMSPSQMWNRRNNSDYSARTSSTSYSANSPSPSSSSPSSNTNSGATAAHQRPYKNSATGIGYVNHAAYYHDKRASAAGLAPPSPALRHAYSSNSLSPSPSPRLDSPSTFPGHCHSHGACEAGARDELKWVPEDRAAEENGAVGSSSSNSGSRRWKRNSHAVQSLQQMQEEREEREIREIREQQMLGYGRGGRGRKFRQSMIW